MNEKKALILVNATVGDFSGIKSKTAGLEFKKISLVEKKTGEVRRANFTVNGDEVSVLERFEYLSTQTLILE
jgi:hypothetical protein